MLAGWFAAAGTLGAELRLRSQCTAAGPVVKLGDVAEIFAADRQQVERLAAIELFPAPMAPQQRFLGIRELQDLLLLRGVNLAEHAFSGSSQITVQGHTQAARADASQSVPPAMARKFSQHVCEAVVQYLKQHAAANQPWIVEAQLSDAEARPVADAGRAITISGGNRPGPGHNNSPSRRPVLRERSSFRSTPGHVAGQCGSDHPCAGPRRRDPLRRRRIGPRGAGEQADGDFRTLAEVVGKETTRAIAAEKPLMQRRGPRADTVVRRGEVVTVYARASGIRIRTVAGPATTAARANWCLSNRWPTAARFSLALAAFARSKCMRGRRGRMGKRAD